MRIRPVSPLCLRCQAGCRERSSPEGSRAGARTQWNLGSVAVRFELNIGFEGPRLWQTLVLNRLAPNGIGAGRGNECVLDWAGLRLVSLDPASHAF
jgi:hypothetical protein